MASGPSAKKNTRLTLSFVWLITILASGLPEFLFNTFARSVPSWLFWAQEGFLLGLLAVCLFFPPIKSLWKYVVVLALLTGLFHLVNLAYASPVWQQRFGSMWQLVGTGITRLFVVVIAFVMMGALLLMGLRRRDFFFTPGQLDAPMGRIRWLGVREGTSWQKFAPIFAGIVSFALLGFLIFVTRTRLAQFPSSLVLLPMVIFITGINAFGEELGVRAPLLATIHPVIGKGQAMLLIAVYFGLLHLDIWPSGVFWALETGFVGWILAKSMLETRGSLWAWIIHLVVDIPVYLFIAIARLS